ncbi:MAG: FAD-dependent monooxygenase, partial [Saprospiraceae bacterium]|nr:FAD-dependent monooxygenase [Saprospiraceae bacterium]
MNKNEKVIIIGAGLCGTLLAVRLAQRGYQVSLHEKRSDMRREDVDVGRSINLALSNRGLKALERVGLKDAIMEQCIPMKGRMIHPLGGEKFLSRYSGRDEDYINSVSRGGLNIALLDEAEKLPNIQIYFESDCTGINLKEAIATFKNNNT